ncbi:MAG: hypothetical protein KKF79_02050 [Gammaproteobacteria bacterium]|nr:hypothetical protein [Gammaproteobacteria bacterium]MBU2224168.1 hypothetical protein [Gammaproteobacteria bacterium]
MNAGRRLRAATSSKIAFSVRLQSAQHITRNTTDVPLFDACPRFCLKIKALLFGVLNERFLYKKSIAIYKAFASVATTDDSLDWLFPPIWKYSDDELMLRCEIEQNIIPMADDVLFLNLGREEKYFLYLVRKSDFYLTYQELKEAKRVTKWQVKDSRRGLQWVIRKLNQKRPPSKQIGPQI